MLKIIENIDWWLFDLINKRFANDLFDAFFPYITNMHKKIEIQILILLILLFWFWRQKKKMLKVLLVLTLSLAFSDLVTYRILKQAFQRTRPNNLPEIHAIVRDNHPKKFSFPSNHATNTMTGAVILAQVFPAARWAFFVYAGLIAYSRVYSGVHFPFDVLAGLFIGYWLGKLCWFVTKKTKFL
ncbi:MAG: phosphatase PAP2 family protein [Bdellovibrionales bacterium]|nr:phosphatase PAP2 family protein [Bdellovibrionales bacterium]